MHLTDAGYADYYRVFARVFQVDIQNATASRTVFQNLDGVVVDLRALGPDTGRLFFPLGSGPADIATYTNVSILVDTNLFVVDPLGTGTPKQFATSLDAGGGRSRLVVNLTSGTVSSGDNDIVLDFDLAAFTEDGSGRVLPVVRQVSDPALSDPARFVEADYRGVVANLGGAIPGQTFELQTPSGTFRVAMTASTRLMNEGSGPNPVLANSDILEVSGRYDATGRRIIATAVQKESPGGDDPVSMRGAPIDVDGETGRFQLEVTGASGLFPTSAEYTVATTGLTIFKGLGGRALGRDDFFFDLIAAAGVRVEGSMDAGGRLIASRVFIESSLDEFAPDSEVEGVAAAPDLAARTFAVEATEFQGFAYAGPNVGVTISEVDETFTALELEDGTPLTTAEFFAAIASRPVVNVVGRYVNGRIEASWIIVRS